MSALHSPTEPGTFLCPRCGSTLRNDQGWCLECGLAARTRIHPPPSWRLPVLVTCALLALLAAGIAVTLVTLLDTPEATPAPATVTVPATAPPAATVPPVTTPPVTTPTTTVPGTAPPATSTPTTPAPPGTTPTTPPADSGAPRARTRGQGTITVPGTDLELPAGAD